MSSIKLVTQLFVLVLRNGTVYKDLNILYIDMFTVRYRMLLLLIYQ